MLDDKNLYELNWYNFYFYVIRKIQMKMKDLNEKYNKTMLFYMFVAKSIHLALFIFWKINFNLGN